MLDAIKVGREHNLDYVYKGLTPPPVLHMKYKFYEKTIYSLLKRLLALKRAFLPYCRCGYSTGCTGVCFVGGN